MQHTLNRVTLQGRIGPPTVRLTPAGPIFASAELTIGEHPDTTVTVCGIGIDAACIADTASGPMLYVEGELAVDPESGSYYVFANTVRRMALQGGEYVPVAPSMHVFDRFERVLLGDAATVPSV